MMFILSAPLGIIDDQASGGSLINVKGWGGRMSSMITTKGAGPVYQL